jgi:hypothetical protein
VEIREGYSLHRLTPHNVIASQSPSGPTANRRNLKFKCPRRKGSGSANPSNMRYRCADDKLWHWLHSLFSHNTREEQDDLHNCHESQGHDSGLVNKFSNFSFSVKKRPLGDTFHKHHSWVRADNSPCELVSRNWVASTTMRVSHVGFDMI